MPVVGAGWPTGPCRRVVVGVVGTVVVGILGVDDVVDDVDGAVTKVARLEVEDKED